MAVQCGACSRLLLRCRRGSADSHNVIICGYPTSSLVCALIQYCFLCIGRTQLIVNLPFKCPLTYHFQLFERDALLCNYMRYSLTTCWCPFCSSCCCAFCKERGSVVMMNVHKVVHYTGRREATMARCVRSAAEKV